MQAQMAAGQDVAGDARSEASPARRRTVLFLVETPGQFAELERLSRLLADHRAVEQVYLVYDCGEATQTIVARVRELGATFANASPSQAGKALRGAAHVSYGLGRIVRYIRDLVHLPVFAAKFRRILRGVDLVVVAEDSVGSRSRALVAAAERLHVPVLLLPFTIVNPDEAASVVRYHPSHLVLRPDQRAFAWLRPRWVREAGRRRLLRVPLGKAVMLELAGLAPPDPWVDNRGPAVIAAESRAMQRRYRALGIPDEQIVLTGSLVDPVLESGIKRRGELRAKLKQRLGLPDRPLLLCALPPDQFRLGPPAACAYSSYPQLLESLLSSLKRISVTFAVVVRPHPRMTAVDLERLNDSGVAVTRDDTASLIPLCDLYVASGSATIRWAIACGRPVVNYDVYRYGYDDYANVTGVLPVDEAGAFDAILGNLVTSPDRLAALADAQADAASEWGCLDGGSEPRLLALYDRLMAQRGRMVEDQVQT